MRLVAVLALGLGVSVIPSETQAQESPESPATQTLEALQRAHAARLALAEEQRAAQVEAARLEATIAEAQVRAELLRLRAQLVREKLAALRSSADPLDARESALTATMDDLVERIHGLLDDRAKATLPDLIPLRPEPPAARAEGRLQAALDRLEQAERQLDQIQVDVVEARLDGQDATVEVLRFGGAAAWWKSLDGERYGVVRLDDQGGRVLQPAPAEADGSDLADRVEQAFDIAKGRAPPDLVLLPVVPLREAAR